ncbi:lipoyl(octanoyl) transferase LipB [Citricoccus sp. GCM10030269]|uniref:lipoyl(octanoyl) transferase LipB n=1 Tax=Citricoccus sp. GCM10030269 TaxID=3273388 RepID=UPI0036144F26
MPATTLPSFHVLGLSPDTVDYQEAWDLQRRLHAEVVAGSSPGAILLLEHTAVYTAGKRTEPEDLPDDGSNVVAVDRGGKLTWHGPGQLVGYPVVRLADPAAVKAYVWFLEEVLIRTLADYGLVGERVDGRSGVWITGGTDDHGKPLPDRKIAAIGLRVHQGVSMHGFALNCNNSLEPYDHIIACGITDAGSTTISAETGRTVSPNDVLSAVQGHFTALAPGHVALVSPTEDTPSTTPHLEGSTL